MTLDQRTALVLMIGRELGKLAEELEIPEMGTPLRTAVEAWMVDAVEVNALHRLASLPDQRVEVTPVLSICRWVVDGREIWL